MVKQQFNVNLPSDLVRRIKHEAIDDQLSLSDWVERVLVRHLERSSAMSRITLQPMVHVEDLGASVRFYEALGAQLLHGSRDGDFAMLALGDARFSLLAHPANPEQHEGEVELNFEAVDLDAVAADLRGAGIAEVGDPVDEGFGRQLQVTAPGGLLIKINELDPELYT
jgi:hypothetical protein